MCIHTPAPSYRDQSEGCHPGVPRLVESAVGDNARGAASGRWACPCPATCDAGRWQGSKEVALIAVVDERLLLLFRRHVKFETPNLIPTALKLAGAYAMLSTAIHTMLDVGVDCSRGGRQRLFPTPGGILRTNLESSNPGHRSWRSRVSTLESAFRVQLAANLPSTGPPSSFGQVAVFL